MDDPHVVQPGHAPTPFTSDEIRQGCPAGRTVIARTEASGEPDRVDLTVFAETDEAGAVLESNGQRHRVTWRDLQTHASFPAEMTSIAEEIIEIPLGTMECHSYRVESGDTVSTFWFAKDRPGMPVLFTTEQAGALTSTTFVIDDFVHEADDQQHT
jgi:hypothetical protein